MLPEASLSDPARTLEVFLRLLAFYAACLAAGFALKRLARGLAENRDGTGTAGPAAAAAPVRKGPGIGGKFKVFFGFQALILSLSFWWLPGLGLFLLVLFLAAAFEVHALGKTAGQRPGYPFRPGISWGLVALLGLSSLSFLAYAAGVTRAEFLNPTRGLPFLSLVFLLVAVFDGYSQIWGEILGGRRMVPRISPGKTWSGFFGGLSVCMAAALLGQALVFPWLSLPAAAITGFGVGVLAFLGDITASWVKRRLGIKDFSNLLGPQGGVLDRADSLLWLGPALLALHAASVSHPFLIPLVPRL